MMPDDALDTLRQFEAIYLGAVGDPSVPDHVSLRGLLLPIRQAFQQYVNLRPVRLLPGVPGVLADRGPGEIDFICIREKHRGRVRGGGGTGPQGHGSRAGVADDCFYARGRGASHPLRVRAHEAPETTAPDQRHQVQRHAVRARVLG